MVVCLIPLINEKIECLGSINLARCSLEWGEVLRSGWEKEASGVSQREGFALVYARLEVEAWFIHLPMKNSLFKRYPFKK